MDISLEELLKIIKYHPEGEGDYCDTGEDMDWYCRSNCIELAVERLKVYFNQVKESTND